MSHSQHNATDYEQRYQSGYGLVYPESHIIRAYHHILRWELQQQPGGMFDFGCGSGSHMRYFADQGYTPYGADVSETAIQQCRAMMPAFADHFHVIPASGADIVPLTGENSLRVFLSNQTLYYLDDAGIRAIAQQAHTMLAPGGVFIASMMSPDCWYTRYITGQEGDFQRIELRTAREAHVSYINIKPREALEPLFAPFRKLHIGMYGSHIREEEGLTAHWLYVGIKD